MNNIYLTIGIPTYNRFKKLEKTVENVLSQIEADVRLRLGVEILVHDNNSSDKTEKVINNFNNKIITYHKHKNNLGFDSNVDSIFKSAKGKFVWILSDDDFLFEKSIIKVFLGLKTYSFVNFAFINYNVNVNNSIYKQIQIDFDKIVESNNVFNEIGCSMSFVSACIFNRKQWNNKNSKKYFKTGWIHLYMARDILTEGKTLLFADSYIEMIQHGLEYRSNVKKINGIDYFMNAHIKLVNFCYEIKNFGYSQDTFERLYKYCFDGEISQIFNYKLQQDKINFIEDFNIIKLIFPYRKNNLVYFFVKFIPLILIPPSIYRLLKKIKNKLALVIIK